MAEKNVAILTAGGLAPCLSSAVGGLIERYSEIAPELGIRCYIGGYQGLLRGESIEVGPELRRTAHRLHLHGGSPIGNSRVKLTNVADCVKRGLVKEGEDPLVVACDRLVADGVHILHTVGGDDTNTSAADLAAHLEKNDFDLTVVGLPKTVDNDVVPIRQTLGALTAAEQGAIFFENVVNEHSASPRMLVVHEVMGRNCGWLTAATAHAYRKRLGRLEFVPGIGLDRARKDVHGVYVPERPVDLEAEAKRLSRILDQADCVNVFVSEGAGADAIVAEMEAAGKAVPRDAFGHARLDKVNVGEWIGEQLKGRIGAEKVLVQKSGYFARSAAANREDLLLIKSCVDLAVECALRGESGVVGHDIEKGDRLRAIEFTRIAGGRAFDPAEPFFARLLAEIGQA